MSAVKAGNKAGMGSYVFDHFLAAEDFLGELVTILPVFLTLQHLRK